MSAPLARGRAPWWYLPVGALIGFAGALCGIGGGLFAGPLMHATGGLALKRAAASALLLVLATTGSATLTELFQPDSQLRLGVAVALSLGALYGAGLGFKLQQRLRERTLKWIFAGVLAVAGLRVLLSPQPVGGGLDPGPWLTEALAFGIGIAGGFLTPLLGIAGGIVMVPALFLSLGPLGFPGARACALAAGAVGALRSLRLHARAGNVDFVLGLPLALGALAGALAGVLAAHQRDLAHAGRLLLGALLLWQALGFGRQLARTRSAGGQGGAGG